MASKFHVVRSGRTGDSDPETQVWPVTALVILASAASMGVIAARGDFATPDLVDNAWSRLSLVALLTAVAVYAGYMLRGRVLMRVQVAVLVTLLLHLFFIGVMNEYRLAVLQKEEKRDRESIVEEELPTLLDYGIPIPQAEQQNESPLERLREMETPDKPRTQPVERQIVPEDPHTKPEPKPVQPKPTPTVEPQKVDLERTEASRPRAADQLRGQELSRREQAAADPTEQSDPKLEQVQPQQAPSRPAEARTSVARQESKTTPELRPTATPKEAPAASTASDAPRRETRRNEQSDAPSPAPTQVARSAPAASTPTPARVAPQAAPEAAAPAPQAAATTASRTEPNPASPAAPARPSPASAAPAPQTVVVADRPSQATRTSAPAVAQTPSPSPVPRASGAAQPAPQSEPSPTPASIAAANNSQTNVEAAPTAVARAQPGAGGSAPARNFSNELPNAPSPAASASTSSARASTRTNAPDSAPAPSSVAVTRRSVTSAETSEAASLATSAPSPDATASRDPSPTETASSAARRSAASNAPVASAQTAAGVGPVDLGPPALVAASEGLSRGASSAGGGEPNVAASAQSAKLGRATPAGETHPASDAATIAQLAASSGSDPNRVVGPQVDAESSSVARTRDSSSSALPTTAKNNAAAGNANPTAAADATAPATAVARAAAGSTSGAADGISSNPTRISRADGAANATGESLEARPVELAGTTPNGSGSTPGAVPSAEIARQATGGADAAAVPRLAGATGATGLGRAMDLAEGGAGPRSPLGESDDVPAISGDGTAAGLERASVGDDRGPNGDAPGEKVAAASAIPGDSPAGDAAELKAGEQTVGRRAAGVEVDLPATPGVGGLTLTNPGELGLPERRARRESTLASLQIARFVLDKSGGKRANEPNDPGELVPTYMLREREVRSQVAEQFGGTKESEQSVELGLAFLARVQQPDGSWTLHNWPGEPRGDKALSARNRRNSETAGTGLALLAFLGAGYDHTDGPYQQVVKRGLDWLVRKQKEDGDLFTGGDDPEIRMYAHGIAAIPLCEAYAMSRDPELREPVRKALQFTLKAQDLKWGGWRYQPGRQSDTSVTGWQMMSLKSGELSGFGVPPAAYEGVTKWLDFAARGPDGNRLSRYAYLPATNAREESDRVPNPAMTAESLLMRLYLGWERNHPALQSGADYLLQNPPPTSLAETSRRDCYYWYYGTQVMYQMQGRHWQGWNDRLRPLLVDTQIKQGELSGSWDPRGDKWGEQGGRLYVTCMHLLMLEVYYRHLPLFRLDDGTETPAVK